MNAKKKLYLSLLIASMPILLLAQAKAGTCSLRIQNASDETISYGVTSLCNSGNVNPGVSDVVSTDIRAHTPAGTKKEFYICHSENTSGSNAFAKITFTKKGGRDSEGHHCRFTFTTELSNKQPQPGITSTNLGATAVYHGVGDN